MEHTRSGKPTESTVSCAPSGLVRMTGSARNQRRLALPSGAPGVATGSGARNTLHPANDTCTPGWAVASSDSAKIGCGAACLDDDGLVATRRVANRRAAACASPGRGLSDAAEAPHSHTKPEQAATRCCVACAKREGACGGAPASGGGSTVADARGDDASASATSARLASAAAAVFGASPSPPSENAERSNSAAPASVATAPRRTPRSTDFTEGGYAAAKPRSRTASAHTRPSACMPAAISPTVTLTEQRNRVHSHTLSGERLQFCRTIFSQNSELVWRYRWRFTPYSGVYGISSHFSRSQLSFSGQLE